jgi:hypothetical protein
MPRRAMFILAEARAAAAEMMTMIMVAALTSVVVVMAVAVTSNLVGEQLNMSVCYEDKLREPWLMLRDLSGPPRSISFVRNS